ncbi:S8 family serine peptidase [Desulfobotulus sp.]|uniref:S8 family serine peptidase n=1 Tax=Desulfobotulus sp. TaxID=1940337 RepID=UPI002A35E533|nr:S8 family serine peptidase [Desulfobotulus sp.]MDY0163285.1 S8 family serine peptidase [Desulfobotulus sp.]
MIRAHMLWLVWLFVFSACGSSGEVKRESGTANEPPVAEFLMDIPEIFTDAFGNVRAPARIYVDAALSSDPDGVLSRYVWQVNGETVGEGRSRWLDLSTAGTHRITLRVTDDGGLSQTQEQSLVLDAGGRLSLSGKVYAVSDGKAGSSGALGVSPLDVIPGEMVVRFREGGPGLRSSMGEEGWRSVARQGDRTLFRLSGERRVLSQDRETAVRETLDAIREMALRADVLWASPNLRRRVFTLPVNDAAYVENPDRFWPLEAIFAPGAWEKTQGQGAAIAVLDTGVLAEHPDLKDRLGPDGYDFVDQDGDPEDPGTGSAAFHGTQVAGIALATANNGIGMAGVAGKAVLMPLRVIDAKGEVSTWALAEAIRYAAGLENASGLLPSRKADVISLSLGGEGENPLEKEAVEAALRAGVLVVAAAGNDGADRKNYPAGYAGVFAVGGVGRNLQRHPDSNYGDWISLVAPWGPVYTTSGSLIRKEPTYTGTAAGTSMATPFVSGVLALMRSQLPTLSLAQTQAILERGGLTRDLGVAGKDMETGWGLVNAAQALEGLGGFFLSALPEALHMGISGLRAFLYLAQGDEGASLFIQKPQAPDWIRVTGKKVHGDGFGLYEIEILRDHGDFPADGGATHLEIRASSGLYVYPVYVEGIPAASVVLPDDSFAVVLESLQGEGSLRIPLDRANRDADGGYPWVAPEVPAGLYRIYAEGKGGVKGHYPGRSGEVVWLYPQAPDTDRLDFVIKNP